MITDNSEREHASRGAGPKGHGARHAAEATPSQAGASGQGSEAVAPQTGQAVHDKHHKHTKKDLEHRTEELAAEIDRLKTQAKETQDKYLRALADFDNYRKRVARENQERIRCANEDLIARLLEVVDNVERAFAAADAASDPGGLKKGLELIFAQLKDILTKEGLCPIECVGAKFDPNYHEAVRAVEREGAESENIVEELQKGYMLKGKLLRPSKVVVAK